MDEDDDDGKGTVRIQCANRDYWKECFLAQKCHVSILPVLSFL